jgi:hypothetical protein
MQAPGTPIFETMISSSITDASERMAWYLDMVGACVWVVSSSRQVLDTIVLGGGGREQQDISHTDGCIKATCGRLFLNASIITASSSPSREGVLMIEYFISAASSIAGRAFPRGTCAGIPSLYTPRQLVIIGSGMP